MGAADYYGVVNPPAAAPYAPPKLAQLGGTRINADVLGEVATGPRGSAGPAK